MSVIIASLLSLLCTFLILLILIQRGKGGGLAGAFGGMGGQSAFGTKAGDTFMRITIVAAAIWFTSCIAIHILYKPSSTQDSGMGLNQDIVAPAPVDPASNSGTAPE